MASAVAARSAAFRKLSHESSSVLDKKTNNTRQPNGLLNQQATAAAAANANQPPGGLPASGALPSQQSTQQAPKKSTRKLPKAPERAQRVLFCLDLKNPIRKKCIEIVEWKYPFHNYTMFDFFLLNNLFLLTIYNLQSKLNLLIL